MYTIHIFQFGYLMPLFSSPALHLFLSQNQEKKKVYYFSLSYCSFFSPLFSFVRERAHARALVISLSIAFKLYSCTYRVAAVALFTYVFICKFIFGFRRFITQTIIVWNIYCCQCMTRYDIHSSIRLVDSLFLYVSVSCNHLTRFNVCVQNSFV